MQTDLRTSYKIDTFNKIITITVITISRFRYKVFRYLNLKRIVNGKRFFPGVISHEEVGRDVPAIKKRKVRSG